MKKKMSIIWWLLDTGSVLQKGVLKNFKKFIGKHLCWNVLFLINKHKKERLFRFSLQEKIKNYILTHRWLKSRLFSPKIRALSYNFQENSGETSLSPPSSYVLKVIRKYRTPLFTKFAIVKLKIDLFSVSMIFLKKCSALNPVYTGRKLNVNKTTGEVVCCLFRRALFT